MNQNKEEIFPKIRKDFWQDSRYATRYANSVESTTSDLNDVVASTSMCRYFVGVQCTLKVQYKNFKELSFFSTKLVDRESKDP